MCCRYYIDRTEELEDIAEEMNRSPLMNRVPSGLKVLSQGEIRPTNVAPVIATSRSGKRSVFPMKWGFSGKQLLINARTETAALKPAFREAWAGHRCAIPASWYFEWEHLLNPDGKKKTGSKYKIHPENAALTWLGGLYRVEDGFPCFVVLTREPGEGIRFIHNRMPLILSPADVNLWIHPDTRPETVAENALTNPVFSLSPDSPRGL